MIMMAQNESYKVDKDSAEGAIDLKTLALRLAQSKGLKMNGKYQYHIYIKDGKLYWMVDKVADLA